ncbi:MAG TPA: hypothetical protein ENJ06_03950 [Phycisphaeraceae bacterium]|nr:hypothetical protein [Phycisphaeraceae bacterium]
MAKKKTKKKNTRRKKTAKKREPRDWSLILSRTTSAVIVLFFIAIGIGWVMGLKALRRNVADLQNASADIKIKINWPLIETTLPAGNDGAPAQKVKVPYLGAETARALQDELLINVKADPFDLQSLEYISDYLNRTGWVRGYPRVVREPGNTIAVTAHWRWPRWVVRYDNYDYVVGNDLGLLPLRVPDGQSQFRYKGGEMLRFIDGVTIPPPYDSSTGLAYGKAWPGSEVSDAAALLDVLSREKEIWSQVAGVRVQNSSHCRLVVITDRGSEILWGARPGEEGTVEVALPVKLAHLKSARRHTGRIDWGESLSDVRTEQFEINRTTDSESG